MVDFLTKFQVFLAKEESTYGTDPTPTPGSNAKEVSNLQVNYSSEPDERDIHRNTLSQDPPIASKRFAEITFSAEVKGSGSAGTAPAIGDFLEACGFSESVDAGSSVVYLPDSNNHKSLTFYRYKIASNGSAKLEKFVGARGSVNFVFMAGKKCMADFTFRSALGDSDSDVSEPSPTYGEITIPPIVQNASFDLAGVSTFKVQQMNIDIANEVVEDEDFNAASAGLAGFLITGRKPVGTINPDTVLVATHDIRADWEAATERVLNIVVGSTAGNKITFNAPKVSLDSISDEDLNGKAKLSIPFRLNRDSADDELSIKFE